MDSYNSKNNSGYDEFEDEASTEAANSGGNKFSKEKIIEALKKPKNLFILIGTVVFLLLAFFRLTSSEKKPAPKVPTNENVELIEKIPQVPNLQEFQAPQTNVSGSVQRQVAPPSLPSLDINLFRDLDEKEQKGIKQIGGDAEDLVNSIDLSKLQAEIEKDTQNQKKPEDEELSFDDFLSPKTQNVVKIRRVDPENPPPSILQGGAGGFVDKTKRTPVSDFIFIDSSLDAEISDEVPNEGKKIADLGNIIAQGRILDAVLESAIDSSIPGTIRAIVSKDVYAEAGRSILVPKGTRLYGSYSAGGGRTGRIIIKWSRIIRPDGISLGIDSFASDQFGRAGIEGDVDKKYGEVIASALLLSSIPLVATIAAQQATGGRTSDVTITDPSGGITSQSDPINRATEKFSDEISKATEQIVKDLIDTTIVVRIPQGTRIKVMVNQDLKLPRYKPLTALNTTVTNSSQ